MVELKRLGGVTACVLAAWTAAAAPVAFTKEDARAAYEAADALVKECTPRHAGTLRGRLAANWLLDRASWSGADAVLDPFKDQTPFGERQFCNVMIELPGTRTNDNWIVIMSHFDTPSTAKQPCVGANDGASTSGLLIALADAINRTGPHPDNIALVWTDGEECAKAYGPNDGFHGSRHLVDLFRRKNRSVKTAICLDMLGDKDLQISVPANSTAVLKKLAVQAAEKAGLKKLLKVEKTLEVSDDHSVFLAYGCPAIDFIDFSYGPGNAWWHTPEDTMDKVSEASLLSSGRLVTAFLNILLYGK